MTTQPKKSRAFRPSLDNSGLETRVVLNGATVSTGAIVAAQNAMERRQVLNALRNQLRNTSSNLRGLITSQIGQLLANGIPTAQQRADFNALVAGELFGTAFQLSSQAGLLPGSSRLVSRVQQSLLGNSPRSLLTRLETIPVTAGANATARTIQLSLSRAVNNAINANQASFNNFVATTPLTRLSVDQAGNRIPLQQFMGNQVIAELGNTLGSLSQSFPNVANTSLFANGALTATPQNQLAFINQAGGALGTVAFQLGSNLSLFRNSATTLGPQLQSALFGTAPTSLFTQIQNLPNASATFNTAATTAFNNGFQSLITPLSSFFNIPSTSLNVALPTAQLNPVIGPGFDSVSNGFNGGFGSGFIGFGTAPTTFNTNFSNGFNNFATLVNTGNGFNVPTVNTLPIGVPGTGTTTGTGTGTTTTTTTGM